MPPKSSNLVKPNSPFWKIKKDGKITLAIKGGNQIIDHKNDKQGYFPQSL